MTKGSAWFSNEEELKGTLEPGKFADIVVLSQDYLTIDESRIPEIESVLTLVNGQPVYGAEEFNSFDPQLPKLVPKWSPVNKFGGYYQKNFSEQQK